MLLQANDHVLFYGDSITEAGRFSEANNNGGLGVGYSAFIAAELRARYPRMNLRFTNAGVSGHRVYDLEGRMTADLVAPRPTLVSILVGVNDTWRRYDTNVPSPIDDFLRSYRAICRRVKEDLNARLVICEPFLLHTPAERATWREDLNPRIDAVRQVAREFADLFVPLDGVFAAVACGTKMEEWLGDGVHPTPAGHALIAQHWIDAVTR